MAASVASLVCEQDEDVNEAPLSDFNFNTTEDETSQTSKESMLEEAPVEQKDDSYEPEAMRMVTNAVENERQFSRSPDITLSSISSSQLSPCVYADLHPKADLSSPPSPSTQLPQLSPIQLSLADLGKLRRQASANEINKELIMALPTSAAGSLPGSPKSNSGKIALAKSWSRENLRKPTQHKNDGEVGQDFEKNSSIRRIFRTDSGPFYVNEMAEDCHSHSAGKNQTKIPHCSHEVPTQQCEGGVTEQMKVYRSQPGDSAVSESGITDDNSLDWHEEAAVVPSPSGRVDDDASGPVVCQPSRDQDEADSILRDERNAYRDMCLTLGAEVSKLRNLLAAEQCCHYYPVLSYGTPALPPFFHANAAFGPEYTPPFFHGSATGAIGRIAMSDAGQTRGDYESIISEDGNDVIQGNTGSENPGRQWAQHHCDAGTVAESDVSVDFASRSLRSCEVRKLPSGHLSSHGLQSRLSSDIELFLQAVSAHLLQTEDKRKAAIARFNRMVALLWPRAQVKMYGSHISNLCLPSSDLDFVICLPAVHKNAPAVAPGVLEGRNAINETWQKSLARTLKGESWIEPRTIKIIERTAVPVIKVSTKDVRAKVLQLDISFDGPGHHGLEAINMVKAIMEVSIWFWVREMIICYLFYRRSHFADICNDLIGCRSSRWFARLLWY